MSEGFVRADLDAIRDPTCEHCGTVIDEVGRDCPALDAGVCAP